MKKNYIRKNTGITLIVLVITIIILLILAAVVIYSLNSSPNTSKFNKMKADIDQLHDKILGYNQRYGELPILGRLETQPLLEIIGDQRAPNDSDIYYEIDISKLENLTLSYGNKKYGEDDIYVVNSTTFNVYYLKGIELEGELFHVGVEYTGSLLPAEGLFDAIITASTEGPTNEESITYTFIFDDDVTGFTENNIKVTNGTKGIFIKINSREYTLVVTTKPGQKSIQKVSIEENIVEGSAGGGNKQASKEIEIDRGEVAVVITASQDGPTNAASITYTFTFNKAVTGFATGDVTVTNGTKGAFTAVSSTVYTLVVTTVVNQNNTQTVSIAAGVCMDTIGNSNAAASKSVVIDRVAPTCIITASPDGPTNASSITYTFTFSEAVIGFEIGDVTVTNGTKETFSGSGTTYALVVTNVITNGNQVVSIATGVCTDLAGNNNIAASKTVNVIKDVTPPTCIITATTNGPTNASSITYTFTFSEPVTGFEVGDVTVANGTKGIFTTVSSTVYTLVVTTVANQNNTQTVSIGAGCCTDLAGNNNTAASKAVVIDRVAPTVSENYQQAADNLSTVTVNLAASDAGSGLSKIEVQYPVGTTLSTITTSLTTPAYTTPTAHTANTSRTYRFIVYDLAGNTTILDVPVTVTDYIPIYNQTQLASIGKVSGTDTTGIGSLGDTTRIDMPSEKNAGAASGKRFKFSYNTSYKLMNSISLVGAWSPIGSGTGVTNFAGKFAGQNYTISNLIINATNTTSDKGYGLFSNNTGTISNLKLSNVNISVNTAGNVTTHVGGIIGYNRGIVENCEITSGTIQGNMGSTSSAYYMNIGGITGYSYGSSSTSRGSIKNCKNSGTIAVINTSTYTRTGGIVGYNYYYSDIETNTNTGGITGVNYIGGITGNNTGYSSSDVNIISGGTNSGVIVGTGTTGYIGGIIGSTTCGNISDCKNNPQTTTITSPGAYVGGIVGNGNQSVLTGCTNSGKVTGEQNVGGIAGGGMNSTNAISGCTNTGVITATSTGTTGNVGGIIGYNYYRSNVIDCINNGSINGNYSVGGITGNSCSGSKITNCINNGSVYGIEYIGGIAGQSGNSTLETTINVISDCTNTVTITLGTAYTVGGIVGNSGQYTQITNCSNQGQITTGGSYVGGISGNSFSYNVITNCTNSANIKGRDFVGGIAAISIGNSTSYRNTITGCKNTGTVTAAATGATSTQGEAGGITAAASYTNIATCHNQGAVTAYYLQAGSVIWGLVGGIVGEVSTASIDRCFNEGAVVLINQSTVTSSHGAVGGIAGRGNAVISNCFNTGAISSTATKSTGYILSGGIFGFVTSESTLTNCHNIGGVTGPALSSSRFGALIGSDVANTTNYATLSNCYFYRKTTNVPSNGVGERAAAGVTALNATQANTQSSYSGWDFTTIWQKDASCMPHLRGLTKPASVSI